MQCWLCPPLPPFMKCWLSPPPSLHALLPPAPLRPHTYAALTPLPPPHPAVLTESLVWLAGGSEMPEETSCRLVLWYCGTVVLWYQPPLPKNDFSLARGDIIGSGTVVPASSHCEREWE